MDNHNSQLLKKSKEDIEKPNNKSTISTLGSLIAQFLKKYKRYMIGLTCIGLVLYVKFKFYDKLISISDVMEYIKLKKIEKVRSYFYHIGSNW